MSGIWQIIWRCGSCRRGALLTCLTWTLSPRWFEAKHSHNTFVSLSLFQTTGFGSAVGVGGATSEYFKRSCGTGVCDNPQTNPLGCCDGDLCNGPRGGGDTGGNYFVNLLILLFLPRCIWDVIKQLQNGKGSYRTNNIMPLSHLAGPGQRTSPYIKILYSVAK